MNFTSFHFVIFFFVTLFFGHLLKNRNQRIFLLLASYYFYGVFEPWYLSLILISTIIDYLAGLGIKAGREQSGEKLLPLKLPLTAFSPRSWLTFSLVSNIGLLAYFKYTNFGVEVVNDLQPYGDTIFALPGLDILLPVGISFYTFQSLSYTIDVYRGDLEPRRDVIDFALYVAFFPQLVAGPIVRATDFLVQLDEKRRVTREDLIVGFTRIVHGFFKKLVLADNLGIVVNNVFANPAAYGTVDIWIASIGFGFQIYLDFAGYTDIARGVARFFGFEFKLNFLYPMASANIKEHWARWHISLTTWMRDYVYIPLGGSRTTPLRFYRNLFLTWFGVGLWHGAAYHFIFWGLWQACMLMIHRLYSATALWRRLNEKGGLAYNIFSRLLTIFALTFGFIWFRAETLTKATLMQGKLFGVVNLTEALEQLSGIFSGSFAADKFNLALSGPSDYQVNSLTLHDYGILLFLYFCYEYFMNHYQLEYFWKKENRRKLIALLTGMLFAIVVFSAPDSPAFLYFQF